MKKISKTTNRTGKKPATNKRGTGKRRQGLVRKPAPAYGGPGGEVVLYRAKDGVVTFDVRMERETIWLTQKQMSILFDKDTDTIGLHLRNILMNMNWKSRQLPRIPR